MQKKHIEKLFVTGLGFTGSGCILDWMREQENVSVVPVRPFRYYSLSKLEKVNFSEQILNIINCRDVKTKKNLLVSIREDAILRYENSLRERQSNTLISQLKKIKSLPEVYKKNKVKKDKKRMNPEIDSVSNSTEEFVFDIPYIDEHIKQLENPLFDERRHWQDWFEKKIRSLWASKNRVVFDKSIPINKNRLQEFLDFYYPAKAIVSIRNPVDSIVDFYRIKSTSIDRDKQSTNVDQWIEALNAKMDSSLEQLECLISFSQKQNSRFRLIGFEKFVLEHDSVAAEVAEWFGFQPKLTGYSHFNVKISSSNINIGKSYPLIAQLAKKHPYYTLWEELQGKERWVRRQ